MKKRDNKQSTFLTSKWFVVAGMCLTIFCCCEKDEPDVRYNAEKALYEARQLRSKLSGRWVVSGTEFLEKTLQAYRNIVSTYESRMKEIQGLEEIVLSAQMDLAEVSFQAAMFPEAIKEFKKAMILAENTPEAHIPALYSAAFISEQIEEYQEAFELYERFYELYLGNRDTRGIEKMNTQYLITPLKLAELSLNAGNEEAAKKWLGEAEALYGDLIKSENDPVLLKAIRYNLLTTYLQGKNWEPGLVLLRELLNIYTEETDQGALLFLEAKIYNEGLNERRKALDLFKKIHQDYPNLPEAPSALLSAASIAKVLGRIEEAKTLYKLVTRQYKSTSNAASEAEWQLAMIEEEGGNWPEASVRYKAITKEYPATIQGLEAPLRIAAKYRKDNEHEAARSAYLSAVESYKKLLTPQYPMAAKILAEEYIVRAYVEMEQWQDVVDLLIALPDRYPGYKRFQMNYLTASSILEDEINDREAAMNMLETCIERYPDSEASAEAANQLKRLQDSK